MNASLAHANPKKTGTYEALQLEQENYFLGRGGGIFFLSGREGLGASHMRRLEQSSWSRPLHSNIFVGHFVIAVQVRRIVVVQ